MTYELGHMTNASALRNRVGEERGGSHVTYELGHMTNASALRNKEGREVCVKVVFFSNVCWMVKITLRRTLAYKCRHRGSGQGHSDGDM